MRLEYISPSSIVRTSEEIRKNDETVRLLMESFNDFGFISPILVTPEHKLICGSGRLKASLKAGLESIPCIVVDSLDEDKIKAYRILDNQIAEQSSWNYAKKYSAVKNVKMNLFKYGLPEHYFENIDIDEFFDKGNANQISIFSLLDSGCDE